MELAQLKYLLPRLSGYGVEMSRTGAGIGTRGLRQKLEVDRRNIRNKINTLEKEIRQLKRHRKIQRKGRENLFTAKYCGIYKRRKINTIKCIIRL